jgi:tripartite-type tricarboxylate transporter receptor subunit TctC
MEVGLLIRNAILLMFNLWVSGLVFAQEYPNKPIQLVVPYPPGGVVDITGRLLADQLSRELGKQVIVINKPGAGGTIGAEFVARSPADGYTIILGGAATHAFAPAMYKQLRYDPIKDFVPITQFTEGPLALTVNAGSGIVSIDEFFKVLKSKGDAVNYSSNGIGTFPHLSVELLKQKTGTKAMHIPYPGGGQAVVAVISNEVLFSQNHLPVVLPQAQANRVRILATTGSSRSSVLPDVPTLKESGYDVIASAWFGLFAPAGTPQPIIQKLYEATAVAAKSPALREKLALQGDDISVAGPAKFLAFQKNELDKWKSVITTAEIKPE